MRRSSSMLALAALTLILGCRGHTAGGGPAQPPVERPDEPSEPVPPSEVAVPVGWTAIPRQPDAAAVRHHREGLVHHHAGRHEEALASFDQALATAPDFAWARYDRARALARLRRGDAAVLELQRLVHEDLPTFGWRWAADEDLAPLHATVAGRRLDARLPAIREAYRQAIGQGVPAMTYHARPARDAEGQPRIPHEELRIGVYDPAGGRFVPAVPPVPQALAGYLDREADRALVLAGDVVQGEIYVVQARRVDVSVFDLADPGRVVLQATDVDTLRPETNQIRVAVEAAVEGDDARVTLQQLRYSPANTLSLRVTTDGVELVREPVSSTAPHVHVDANGAFVDVPPPAGLSLEGGRLHVQGRRSPIELGSGHDPAGHPHVARTPDGRFAIVFTVVAGCKEVAYASHVLDRVDLESGQVERLSSGSTHAGVALGPDGSVYLDTQGDVVRFAPGSATALEDVLPGVRFTLPDYDRDCSI